MAEITLQPGTGGFSASIQQEDADAASGAISVAIGEDNTFTQLFRSGIKFGLVDIPAGSTINSATLTLTYEQTGNWRSSNNRTCRVYRCLRAIVTNQMTWNSYSTGNAWATAGAGNTTTDREAAEIGTATFATTASVDDEISFTLTASKIQEMLTDGALTNNGFILKVDTESSDRYQFIGSGGTAAKRPKLVIDYTEPVTPPQRNRSYAYFL